MDPVWEGNILFNVAGAGNMPVTDYITANPLLARNSTGTFHLQAGSPAIGKASGSYPSVLYDMDGQPRSSRLDAGADQVSAAPVKAHILTAGMTGCNGEQQ
ncbi:hypothetical protein CLV51_102753 [Chitinophaga niastensis]|uniref:Uncharacterized protein n=1 Tax=Chitinophaga niastensis TaxID=536980 RepID=A0A2P8HNV4_CHINA|nr:choice-of-anchor Q domain-containing protein [Chitinophaga niastensis]PSL47893.1 hypothetical protein CLV51_102753 [Chitinophaga niastensis]